MYNTLIHYSIELLIVTALILLVGMIKPKWILFWVQKPSRMMIIWIASGLFMLGMVLFGEGNKKLIAEKSQTPQVTASQPAAEVPSAPVASSDKTAESVEKVK